MNTLYYVVIGLGVAFATVFTLVNNGKSFKSFLFKTIASFFFVAIGLLGILKKGSLVGENLTKSITILSGLIVCLVGDMVLALQPSSEFTLSKTAITAMGASAFALGHALYVVGLILVVGFNPVAIIIAVPLVILFTFGNAKLGKLDYNGLTLGILGYAVFLSTAVAVAVCSLIDGFSVIKLLFAIAFVCFYTSDAILMHDLFGNNHSRQLLIWCHVFYYSAQILIASTIALI